MSMMNLRYLICVFCVCGFASVASADVAPPNMAACLQKSVGDKCETVPDKKDGTCQSQKCTRSRPPVDGGAPTTEEYDCTLCVAGSVKDPIPPKADGATNEPAAKVDAGGQDSAGKDAGTTPPKSSGGCDIAASGARFGMGFVLLFLGFLAAWRMTRSAKVKE